ncbi:MAG: xylulokinase [Trueperaceae bacterium]
MRHYVGIDLGTSAVKVLVLREDGVVVAKSSEPYPLKHPAPGRSEQSVDDWWNALGRATRTALAEGGVTGATDVASVALSGQLNGLVLLDERFDPLEDVWIWLDLRSADLARELQREHGALFRRAVENPANPIYVGAKLAWLARERPDLHDRVRHVLLAKDVINLRLTGRIATDHSDASCTLLYALRDSDWDEDLLAIAHTSRDLLPPLYPSDEVIGHVTTEAARFTGLPVGTPVAAGAGDVAALAVGSGAVDVGTYAVTLGTAGHVVSIAEDVTEAGYDRIWQMRHPVPDRIIRLGLVMSGGLCLQWFARHFGGQGEPTPAVYEHLMSEAATSQPGANGVLFLPFLEGSATPFQDPSLTATFHGFRTAHGRSDATRAVIEGVAYNVRDCMDLLEEIGTPAIEVRLSEGGSRSPLWCQVIADVIRRPVVTLRERDSSALGAAILAMKAVSERTLTEVVDTLLGDIHDARFEPDAERAAVYDERYGAYRDLIRRLRDGSSTEP